MAPPSVAREYSITYAGATVGGTSAANQLADRFRLTKSYEKASLTFTAYVRGDSEAAAASAWSAFETAFRTPRGDLVVTLGAQTVLSLKHSTNTGLDTRANCNKVGGDEDNGRLRKYEVTVECDLPADLAGQNGRRSSTVNLTVKPNGHRLLTIEGQYTALSGNSARAQYDASIAAFVASVTAAIDSGVVWDQISATSKHNDSNKVLDFSHSYEEVTSADDTNSGLSDWTLTISRNRVGPGDTPGASARRVTMVTASVNGWGPVGSAAVSNWTTKTRPWMLGRVREYFGTGTMAVVDDTVAPEHKTGQVTGSLQIMMVEGGSVIRYEQTVRQSDSLGKELTETWGGPYEGYIFRRPRVKLRTTVDVVELFGDQRNLKPAKKSGSAFGLGGIDIGSVGVAIGGSGSGGGSSLGVGIDMGDVGVSIGGGGSSGSGGAPSSGEAGAEWVQIGDESVEERLLERGLPGETFLVTERTTTVVERYFAPVKSASSVIFTPPTR